MASAVSLPPSLPSPEAWFPSRWPWATSTPTDSRTSPLPTPTGTASGLCLETVPADFPVGVADALRVYSEEFRDRRMQAAEERAAKIATKMIFPLITCMFPAFFVVTAGPGVMRLVEAFRALAQ